jgi:hypothetical protein
MTTQAGLALRETKEVRNEGPQTQVKGIRTRFERDTKQWLRDDDPGGKGGGLA